MTQEQMLERLIKLEARVVKLERQLVEQDRRESVNTESDDDSVYALLDRIQPRLKPHRLAVV